MAASFIASYFLKVSAVVIILICGVIGFLHSRGEEKREGKL